MAVTPYQIVAPLVSAIAVYYAWSLFLRQKKTLWEVFLWTIFWGGIAAIAAFPHLLSYVTAVTGIKSSVNAVLVTVIGILAFIVFTIIIRLEELRQRHTELVRHIALKEAGVPEASETTQPSSQAS